MRTKTPILAALLASLLVSNAMAQEPVNEDSDESPSSGDEMAPIPSPTSEPEFEPEPETSPPPAHESPTSPARTPAPAPERATGAAPSPRETAATAPAPIIVQTSAPDDDEEQPPPDPYDFLWIDASVGASYVDMRALGSTNFFPAEGADAGDEFIRTYRGFGMVGAVGLGFRIEFLSVGARASLAQYPGAASPDGGDFEVGTVGGEVTLALPIPIFRPFVRVGAGYAWQGTANYRTPAESETTVYGWVFQGAVGFDVYLAHWISLGGVFSVDILNMSRQGVPGSEGTPGVGDVRFEEPGDAVGVQGRAQISLTFHI